jgi:hypothetical protein
VEELLSEQLSRAGGLLRGSGLDSAKLREARRRLPAAAGFAFCPSTTSSSHRRTKPK